MDGSRRGTCTFFVPRFGGRPPNFSFERFAVPRRISNLRPFMGRSDGGDVPSPVVPAIFSKHLHKTQKTIWVCLGPIRLRSTLAAAHSREQILERALEHQPLNES